MAIYLIRHGETEGNRLRILQRPEIPLSERGLEQARRLGERIARAGIARIVSSDLARAAMTAEAVQRATGAPLAFDAGLHERSFGDLRGTAYADLDQDPFAPGYHPPGGESWEGFHERVDQTWQRVLEAAVVATAETGGHLAVVTHGLVCRRVVDFHVEASAAPEIAGWGNTALTILEGPPWKVSLLACTQHLDGLLEEGGAA